MQPCPSVISCSIAPCCSLVICCSPNIFWSWSAAHRTRLLYSFSLQDRQLFCLVSACQSLLCQPKAYPQVFSPIAVLLWQQCRSKSALRLCLRQYSLGVRVAACRDLTLALKEMLGIDDVWCWTPTQATSAQFVTWAQNVLDLRSAWCCCSLYHCVNGFRSQAVKNHINVSLCLSNNAYKYRVDPHTVVSVHPNSAKVSTSCEASYILKSHWHLPDLWKLELTFSYSETPLEARHVCWPCWLSAVNGPIRTLTVQRMLQGAVPRKRPRNCTHLQTDGPLRSCYA